MPLFSDHSASEILKGGYLAAASTGQEMAAAAVVAASWRKRRREVEGVLMVGGIEGRTMAPARMKAPEEFSTRVWNARREKKKGGLWPPFRRVSTSKPQIY